MSEISGQKPHAIPGITERVPAVMGRLTVAELHLITMFLDVAGFMPEKSIVQVKSKTTYQHSLKLGVSTNFSLAFHLLRCSQTYPALGGFL